MNRRAAFFAYFALVFALSFTAACGDNAENVGANPSDASICEDVSCSGHGECAVDQNAEARCICDAGYEAQGTECVASTNACDELDCSGQGECVIGQDDLPRCICNEGYEAQGTECIASTNACDEVDCSGQGECVIGQDDLPRCICEEGYAASGTTCVEETSPCAGIDCSGVGECALSQSGFPVCVCDEGYTSLNADCTETPSACDGIECSGFGDCAIDQNDQPICVCDANYEAEGLECIETFNPCADVDCSGFGECALSQSNQPLCICEEGYEADGTTCVAIDYCEGVTCSGLGECEVQAGAAVCTCDRGYEAVGTACERAFDYVFEGTFTPGPAGVNQTNIFAPLEGVELQYFLAFDATSITEGTPPGSGFDDIERQYRTNAVTFWLGSESSLSAEAQAIVDTLIAELDGRGHYVSALTQFGIEYFRGNDLAGEIGAEFFGFEIIGIQTSLDEDADGNPVLIPFSETSTTVSLRRYTNVGGLAVTDRSDGPGVVAHW